MKVGIENLLRESASATPSAKASAMTLVAKVQAEASRRSVGAPRYAEPRPARRRSPTETHEPERA